MVIAVVLPMGKILLLEDDSHYREIIERVLSGCYPSPITSVATEKQALEALSKENFDLVLLDLYIDGRQCWETLKRVVEHPTKPVAIVLSCEDTERNAEYAVSLWHMRFSPNPLISSV